MDANANVRWQQGDVVRLKSGGPNMTVAEEFDATYVTCQWFDGTKLMGSQFAKQSLIKVEDWGHEVDRTPQVR
ncbi:MAG TPA: DUF2158 domain-containing protein [Chloroflexia bacterium]